MSFASNRRHCNAPSRSASSSSTPGLSHAPKGRSGRRRTGGPFQGPARLPLYQPDFKRSAFIRPNDVDVSRVVTLLFPSWIDVRFTASPLVSRVHSDASGVTDSHAFPAAVKCTAPRILGESKRHSPRVIRDRAHFPMIADKPESTCALTSP